MKKIKLIAKDGASADITSQGAHLCSWIPAGGEEQLFLSRTSTWEDGRAIRGGVPIIFPQFAGLGTLPKHGFARTAEWQLTYSDHDEEGAARASFSLREDISSLGIWPHAFRAQLLVRLSGDSLSLDFGVTNTGDTAFSFTAALHSYFLVRDLASSSVIGLEGHQYRDCVTGLDDQKQHEEQLLIQVEMDRIYLNIRQPLVIKQAHQSLHITQTGFNDAVIWNPGAEKATQLNDLESGAYQQMICVEAAQIASPIVLAPGEQWQGRQCLRVISKSINASV
ncbi:MAG: D-hexose-6-phosphate mutarotase [Undibacterium sp.]|nr:D-hexose-6-phosphate mutarotase [Undibacterium sp.]